MTISVRRLIVTGALLLAGVNATVRTQGTETVTNVPFGFTAGDTKLPQDRYRISPMPGQNSVFMIRGDRHGVVLMSRTDRLNAREPAPSLTFHRYGDQYFLREVQLADGRILHLTQSRAEREYVAAQAAAKSTVVVASHLPK
jgi:hypothetical protein